MKFTFKHIRFSLITLLLLYLLNLGLLKTHHYFFKKHIYDFEKVEITNLQLNNFTPFWEIQGNIERIKLNDIKFVGKARKVYLSAGKSNMVHNFFTKKLQIRGEIEEKFINEFSQLEGYDTEIKGVSYIATFQYLGNVFSSKELRNLNTDIVLQASNLKIKDSQLNNLKGSFFGEMTNLEPYFIAFDLIPGSQFLNKQTLKFKFFKRDNDISSSLTSPHISYSLNMSLLDDNIKHWRERVKGVDAKFSLNLPAEQISHLF